MYSYHVVVQSCNTQIRESEQKYLVVDIVFTTSLGFITPKNILGYFHTHTKLIKQEV